MTFDYRAATTDEIEREAHWLIGRRLDELDTGLDLLRPSSAATKGVVGRAIEAYFGIEQNSRHEPDFVGAGIELKSVPIQHTQVEDRAKERISLGMIDWGSLLSETWPTATARKKLEHLMLVFYGWSPVTPMGSFRVLEAGIWTPDEVTLETLEQDWTAIRQLERDGRRSDVSESLTVLLGAATKGAGHGSTSRAWSLKQPFVGWIYRSMVGRVPSVPSTRRQSDPEGEFEKRVLAKLSLISGRTVADVARLAGRDVSRSKAAAADVVRAYIGEKPRGKSGDFDRFGVETKIVPVNRSGRPVEATSFPSFDHEELAFESWEGSDLLGRLNRVLFIPILRAKGQSPETAIVGRAVFWSPPEGDLRGIGDEWDRYRRLIADGRARDLPTESETRFVHVRTKGRDSRDREPAPGGLEVTKKAFYLNKGYVEAIIREPGESTR